MKKDVTELKKMFVEILQNPNIDVQNTGIINESLITDLPSNYDYRNLKTKNNQPTIVQHSLDNPVILSDDDIQQHEEIADSLMSIASMEKELIIKVLSKHKFKRKDAAIELGISERTLYRKIKDYDLEDDDEK